MVYIWIVDLSSRVNVWFGNQVGISDPEHWGLLVNMYYVVLLETQLLPCNCVVWWDSAVALELCCMVQLSCCHGIILYGETWLLPWNYSVWWNCHVAMELYCMVQLSCHHGNCVVWWVSGILGECTGCQGVPCIKCLLVHGSHNICCGQLYTEVQKSECMHL